MLLFSKGWLHELCAREVTLPPELYQLLSSITLQALEWLQLQGEVSRILKEWLSFLIALYVAHVVG